MASRLTWDQRLDEIQRRIGEQIGTPTSPSLDAPYFDRALDIEPILLEVSNAALRELSIEELGNAKAVQIVTTGVLPITAVRLITARVDSYPAVEVNVAQFLQNAGTPMLLYCIMRTVFPFAAGRTIEHTGTTSSFSLICEQSVATWRSTPDLLPPAYDERTINETVAILSLADNVEF